MAVAIAPLPSCTGPRMSTAYLFQYCRSKFTNECVFNYFTIDLNKNLYLSVQALGFTSQNFVDLFDGEWKRLLRILNSNNFRVICGHCTI